jgi:hypothetical protein
MEVFDAHGNEYDAQSVGYLFSENDGAHFLLAVNDSRETLETVRFAIDSSLAVGSVTRVGQRGAGTPVSRSGNAFEDRFSRFEVKLYRIDIRKKI